MLQTKEVRALPVMVPSAEGQAVLEIDAGIARLHRQDREFPG